MTTATNDATQFDVSGFEGAGDIGGVEMPEFGASGFDEPSYAIEGFEDVDTSGIGADDVTNKALMIDKGGLYHLKMDCEARYDKYKKDSKTKGPDMSKPTWPGIYIRLSVLATSPGLSPVGSVMYHEVKLAGQAGGPIEEWARKQTNAFLVGVGILKLSGDQVIDPQTGTTKVKSSTVLERLVAIGQIVGKVEMSKPTDAFPNPKPEFNWGKGAYPVTDPKVAHVPKNHEALKAAGIELPTASVKPAAHL